MTTHRPLNPRILDMGLQEAGVGMKNGDGIVFRCADIDQSICIRFKAVRVARQFPDELSSGNGGNGGIRVHRSWLYKEQGGRDTV